nr:hypothetical protein KitaXyl93_75720 [Kitasatospora sp. Xyl93]
MNLTAVMITVDCAEPQELARWWATALGGQIAQDHGDFVIVKAEPVALGFQRVAEERRGKNRVHVDFAAAPGTSLTAEVARLVALGAVSSASTASRASPGPCCRTRPATSSASTESSATVLVAAVRR